MRAYLELHREVTLSLRLCLLTSSRQPNILSQKFCSYQQLKWETKMESWWTDRDSTRWKHVPLPSILTHIFYQKSLNRTLWCECHRQKMNKRSHLPQFIQSHSLLLLPIGVCVERVEFVRTIKCVFNAMPLTIIAILKQLTYWCTESNVVNIQCAFAVQRTNHRASERAQKKWMKHTIRQ